MVTWCASNEQVEWTTNWADMPMDLWTDLCIPHQKAILELYYVDVRRLERAEAYWDKRFNKEVKEVASQ